MNRNTFKLTSRGIAVVLLLAFAVSAAALVVVRSTSGEQIAQSAPNKEAPLEAKKAIAAKRNASAATPTQSVLRAEKRGFPLMNLRDGEKFDTQFVGTDSAAAGFGAARPQTLVNADLTADGAQDLVVGYAGADGGYLAVYRGSPNTLSATTPEVFEGFQRGEFPAPFLPKAELIKLPAAPDFIGTGDFNRDGSQDVVTMRRGADKAFLLLGNNAGDFKISYFDLPGRVTAMTTEMIDPLDNQIDIAVGIAGENGASLLLYKGGTDVFGEAPETYPLPSEAVSLAIGQLDNDFPMDILAATDGKLAIVHGALPGDNAVGQIEILDHGLNAAAVRVGNFVWDRENRPEIATLGTDGTVRIFERGTLDKRMFTEAEYKRRPLELRRLIEEENARHFSNYKPQRSRIPLEKWSQVDSMPVAAPLYSAAASAAYFTSTRMTPFGVEDLIVLDQANRKLHVLVWNNDELKESGASFPLSASGERADVTLEVAAGTPVAALPMRLSVMNRPGIVLFNEESSEPTYALAAPAGTFNVNTMADTYDGTCSTSANGCSFRDALQAAANNADSDIINIPAGTITIAPALGGPDQDTVVDPAAIGSGDWDVWYDTTINGAGQGSTILQAAAAQPGHDRVLDAIQLSAGVPDLTIAGITIRNGRCRADFPCVDGGGVRYAVDNLSVLTINNSTVDNNRTEVNTSSPANNGGGIFAGQSDIVFNGITVTNNTAAFVASGCTGATQCGGEGGGAFAGITYNPNPTSVTITSGTFTGNTANAVNGLGGRGGAYAGSPNSVSISGGTFNNNTAFTDGGAFRLFTPTTISGTSTTISNNTARQSGGGIWSDPLANDNTPLTNTFTNVVMRGNTADSDGAIGTNTVVRGDGGAIFHGRGTLNLNNPTIGGTGAGEANTAFDGGGIGRTYSQFTAAVFNASTLNINNGGSIVGNLAINNGGGVLNDATRSANNQPSALNIGATTAVAITNNNARNHGGGIAVITNSGPTPAATASLNNMALRNNVANSDNSGGGDGGALFQNLAVGGGGTTFTGTLTVGGSGFANSAVNGGGIRNNAGTVTIPVGTSITHNTASGTGGGVSNAGTFNTASNVAVTNNTASGNGGGVHNTGTLGAISFWTIVSNQAATGGGIFSSSGALSVASSTVSGNVAVTGKGGGIEHSGSSSSTVTTANINNNTGSGIHITGTGSIDVKTTTITGNTGDGITKIGTGVGSHFDSNVIHSNGELGIDLSDNGVTPNDTNDTDTGPNNLQNFPVINWVRRGDGLGNVTLNAPNGKYRIQYYANATCDPSGHGEGEVLLTSEVKDIITGNSLTYTTVSLAYGTREQITATMTHDANGNSNFDDDGSTSEFSACRQVNRLPTFGTAQTLSRQQGSPVSNGLIANVADLDQAANTLVVTVKGVGEAGAGTGTKTVNGVTVSNIQIAANGDVTADVVASCNATNATFTLRVTDTPGEFNEQTLTVNVTPNTPPTVGNYPNTTVNSGSSGTVITPDAAPADNGSIATVTAVSAPAGFTGTFVGNTTTGAITVNNANAVGVYTVTVTVTDNCGSTVQKQFTLTVNAIPTITAQAGVSRKQGNPVSNSQIATVADADQTEETLVVTVRAVGGAAPGTGTATVNGVTISNITVTPAGVVNADIVATCAAANANFTLRVTDSNGAFNEAQLTVSVTPNTPPTVGTYSNTSVLPGGGTTVTPSAAPADTGSITSATASATGFSGTLSVDATTGVVTIANANPVGTYSVNVVFTDNCGATTTSTFTLVVTTPPTITAATNVRRSQGSPNSNSQIATVNDVDQTENTLVVTVNGGASATLNGVTISSIAVDASGNVTANVVANGTATTATFTLRVTDAQGAFSETPLTVTVVVGGFEADVAPRPNGDGNGLVNSGDVTQVQRFAAGLDRPFQSNEFQRADSAPRLAPDNVTPQHGNGLINAGDVTQAQRYAANLDNGTVAAAGPTAPPPPPPIAPSSSGEAVETANNDVSPEAPQTAGYTVFATRQNLTGNTLTVAVSLNSDASKTAVNSFSGTLRFTPSALSNPTNIRLGAGAPAGSGFFVNTTDLANGRLGITFNAPVNQTVAPGSQPLLLIDFTVAGGAPASTQLSFDDSQAQRFIGDVFGNELTPASFPTNTVTLVPTAGQIAIGGRVLSADNRPVARAVVSITDAGGETLSTTSNSFGFFRFSNLRNGDYVIEARHKSYSFAPTIINGQNSVEDLILRAQP